MHEEIVCILFVRKFYVTIFIRLHAFRVINCCDYVKTYSWDVLGQCMYFFFSFKFTIYKCLTIKPQDKLDAKHTILKPLQNHVTLRTHTRTLSLSLKINRLIIPIDFCMLSFSCFDVRYMYTVLIIIKLRNSGHNFLYTA